MSAYLVKRLMSMVILVLVVVSVVFFMLHALPGDPAVTILGGDQGSVNAEDVERLREKMGLNLPLYAQYADWLGRAVRLDLGTSLVTGRPIMADMGQRIYRSALLVLPAELIAVVFGIPLGILAARLRKTYWDPLLSLFALIGFSVPVFVSGLVLILIFAVNLGWFASGGFVDPRQDFAGYLSHAFLPVIALALGPLAVVIRMTRSSLLEQMGLDYVVTARAKGLAERRVVFSHILRNAMLPVITVIGLQLGTAFAGAVVAETVFNWPGVGRYLIESIKNRDYPVVQGVVLIVACLYVVLNGLTDISFAVLDPRVRRR
ncbi:MAG: ABC transporter permease [Thermomicrobiales bacterium]|nr:ABC transporter permease [Thermomicrobiales bacterium]